MKILSAGFATLLAALTFLLGGCDLPTVYDPKQPIAPNPTDHTVPDLEIRVFHNGRQVDSVVKPAGTFFFSPNRCVFVPNSFHVVALASDFDGGISYLNLGSPDLLPTANSITADPPPDSPTQVDDPASPSVTYPNPGMLAGSHTAEVTYYAGGSPPGRAFGFVRIEVDYDFGGKSIADLSARANNTSVSASTSSIDGYFVRPADATHAAGSACSPPP